MLKISGESLAGSNEQGFDFEILNDLAKSIKILQSKNRSLPKWFYPSISPFVVFLFSLVFASNSIKRFLMERFTVPRTSDPSQIQAINSIRWDLWINDAWVMILFIALFFSLTWMWYNNKISKKVFS